METRLGWIVAGLAVLAGMKLRTLAIGVTLLLAPSLLGCTRLRESFPGQAPEHVWRALVAVAESPDYDHPDPTRRWFVVENDVWLDEAEARIEIYRRLRRDVHRSGSGPHREDRTWRFGVRLEATDPPEATFVSRDWGVPMQALDEARRYFADVRGLLRGPPGEEMTDDDLLDALGLDDSPPPSSQPETMPSILGPMPDE